jgi:hypothetical protein
MWDRYQNNVGPLLLIYLMKIIKSEHSVERPNCRISAHILKHQNLFTIVIASCQTCRSLSQSVSFPSHPLIVSFTVYLSAGNARSVPAIPSVAVGAEPRSRPGGHRHLGEKEGPREYGSARSTTSTGGRAAVEERETAGERKVDGQRPVTEIESGN